MPKQKSTLLNRLLTATSVVVGAYAILLGLLLTPPIQRFALYANKINTLFLGDDLNNGESYGFARHQVTPFNLQTPDGETLHAWHLLPLDVYAENDVVMSSEDRPNGMVDDFTKSTAFRLLRDDPEARVVITFHGNAGHIAQGWRTDTYRLLASQPRTHVLTIDYRGFGYSTGSPTEAGLIIDGCTLVNFVLDRIEIPPSRIVMLGQSLGTAVSSAVALRYADPGNALTPAQARAVLGAREPVVFAGVVLVAPFSSLPSLMMTYRIGGLLPVLLPLRPFPWLAEMLTSQMVDKWLSAERLAAYYQVLSGSDWLYLEATGQTLGSLQLVHSIKDFDITYHQTEMVCRRILGEGAEPGVYEDGKHAAVCTDGVDRATQVDVAEPGKPRVSFEIAEHGGHNRIVTYSQVMLAIQRAFDDTFARIDCAAGAKVCHRRTSW